MKTKKYIEVRDNYADQIEDTCDYVQDYSGGFGARVVELPDMAYYRWRKAENELPEPNSLVMVGGTECVQIQRFVKCRDGKFCEFKDCGGKTMVSCSLAFDWAYAYIPTEGTEAGK